jgi:hypothetical protein
MGVCRGEREVLLDDMAMPASIPTSNTTTLRHIISDPIIAISLFVFQGLKSRVRRAGTHALPPGFVT